MLEDKSKTFEEIFNDWYKMYIDEERKFHEEIRKAKEQRDNALLAHQTQYKNELENYRIYYEDKINGEKNKLEIHKNNFEQVEKQHQLELQILQKDFKENKEKVIEYIIDHVMSVTLEIPENIQKFNKNFKKD